MAENKRKTITSTKVKQRYLDKTYTILSYRELKETAAAFREACEKRGIPQAQILKSAVQTFLEQCEQEEREQEEAQQS